MALACTVLSLGTAYAEVLTGVLYSIRHGQGRNPAGQVELAVGKRIHYLEYAPLGLRFKNKVCYEIGVIWTATVRMSEANSRYIHSVTCTGRVDENTHAPWLVVRDYLEGLAGRRSASPSDAFSSRWRSSKESQQYEAQSKNFDLHSYLMFGDYGRCLEIISIEPSSAARIAAAYCAINVDPRGHLVFDVIRNAQTKKWEIDRIKIQDSREYR